LPQNISYLECNFTIDKNTVIVVKDINSFNAKYLKSYLSPIFNFKITISDSTPKENYIVLENGDKESLEDYTLDVTPKSITIKGSGTKGVFYGIQTLLQLLPSQVYSNSKLRLEEYSINSIHIEDFPEFSYRGLMLDVSRTFYSVEQIKQYMDWMSHHKLNYFHWHLSDDNGWRIEIKKYPLLTEKGAWRGENEVLTPTYNSGNERYGGFYTQKEIKEIVAYAQERGIEIIPEIDLPGHSKAAVATYPSIQCKSSSNIPSACGEFNNVWCVANEKNYKILDDIIKELSKLFPGKYIHIGGDEIVYDYWDKCSDCQALMKREGMEDLKELHAYFVNKMEKIIEKHGKKVAGWDDIIERGEVGKESLIFAWRSTEQAAKSIKANHKTIEQIAEYCYLDMKQSPIERGHSWAAIIPLERAYNFNPNKNSIGIQGGLWSELIIFPPRFDQYQIFPRLCAISETGWSNSEKKNYNDFYDRLCNSHYSRLEAMGIAFRVEPPTVTYENNSLNIKLPYPSAEVRYTMDGSNPTKNSPIINGSILTNQPEDFRFATFFGSNLNSITVGASNIDLHHFITPPTKIETNIVFNEKTPINKLTQYNFNTFVKTKDQLKEGNYLTYIFDKPISCKRITIDTGMTHVPIYGVSNGYVEYSYDGTTFIKGNDLYRYSTFIEGFVNEVKAVRIIVTGPNDGYMACFQNIKIE
jgi:hexosaminidase